jgi:malonyl CoA-acyl carrier protein transacylase
MAMAFIFPGQGSQVVGMGRDLATQFPVAKAVFDEVDAALGQKLSDIGGRHAGARSRAWSETRWSYKVRRGPQPG